MRDSILIGTLAAVVLAGCSLLSGPVTEDNYFEQAAIQSCKLYKDCYAAYFYSEYDDIDDCVDGTLDAGEDYQDFVEDECDFDEDNAADCLAEYKGMSCEDVYDDYEDIYDACSEVWDCK